MKNESRKSEDLRVLVTFLMRTKEGCYTQVPPIADVDSRTVPEKMYLLEDEQDFYYSITL